MISTDELLIDISTKVTIDKMSSTNKREGQAKRFTVLHAVVFVAQLDTQGLSIHDNYKCGLLADNCTAVQLYLIISCATVRSTVTDN